MVTPVNPSASGPPTKTGSRRWAREIQEPAHTCSPWFPGTSGAGREANGSGSATGTPLDTVGHGVDVPDQQVDTCQFLLQYRLQYLLL